MLQSLSIRDFVIVKTLDLEFSTGLTVLTGETGAGKSILIDALSLALGARGEGGVTRHGCEKAEISALFNIAQNGEAKAWLQSAEIDMDDQALLLRRVVYADGRSRAFVNGVTVTITQLKELGEFLVDIYSQNAHHSLLKSATQREVLDQFGGLSSLAQRVAEHYKIWHQLNLQRLEAEKNASAYAEELADCRNRVSELTQYAISASEWEALQQAHVKLANSASLLSGGEACQALLSEGDLSALRLLSQVQHKLSELREYDESLQEVTDLLDSAMISVEETTRLLNRYCQRLDIEPANLADVESQMAEVHQLARKYRVQPEALITLLSESKTRILALELMTDDGKLQQQEVAALASYMQLAEELSAARKVFAKKLGLDITSEMQRLSLSGGRFEVALNGVNPSAQGLEQVEFLVAGHAGVSPKSLAKTASGGELSRISLAIRVVTAQKESIPTMIFDEVDVGIGGGVAEVVGQLLKKLAQSALTELSVVKLSGEQHKQTDLENKAKTNQRLASQRQVLVITHLPQVAAQGEQHLRVSKMQVDAQTLSEISVLSAAERVEEIARMLGGLAITETTRQHAKEMLAH